MTTATQIDWTKAPADTTHCMYLYTARRPLWYKIKDGQPIYYCETKTSNKWLKSCYTVQEIFAKNLYARPQEPLFKVGDRVYCPREGIKVYTLVKNENSSLYPLEFQIAIDRYISFQTNGYCLTHDKCPSIFHATSEKQQALEQLYGVQFEDPSIPTGSDLTRLKLEESNTPVLGYVSNESEADTRCVTLIVKVNKKGQFISHNQSTWLYAVLYDKPIQTGLL